MRGGSFTLWWQVSSHSEGQYLHTFGFSSSDSNQEYVVTVYESLLVPCRPPTEVA
jgi:hypothetical protein